MSTYLDQVGRTYKNQAATGLDDNTRAKLFNSFYNKIDNDFDKASRDSRARLASAGLTASGLSSVANAKIEGERANAVANINANVANMDYRAKQDALTGLLNVDRGELSRESFAERKRQFDEQLAFQKEQAEFGWDDFFGAILGAGTQIGTAAILA